MRYQASQPWPFPHTLMIGFRAEWDSGEIVIDETEIVDAAWFTRDDLPTIPPAISIARRLIDDLAPPDLTPPFRNWFGQTTAWGGLAEPVADFRAVSGG